MVARILVKQAAKWVDRVDVQLSQAFKKKDVPQFDELIEILKNYGTEFSRISNMFVMFDALDECDEKYFGQIVKLIQNLNQDGIRVYATAREHREDAFYQLQSQHLKIEADIQDVEKYLVQELEQRKTDVPDPEFRQEIVKEIAQGVDGMYFTLS
jgi:hypothetical protein